jgi:predicted chitinase
MQMATLQQALKKVAPQVDAARWAPALAAGFAKFGINTNKRVAAAVGQFLSEAGSAFQELEEHLYYTHAERLHAVFPKEFPTVAAATPYVKNPEKLGDFVYANRNGNGNVASGDGYLFRGRGLIQITGRLPRDAGGAQLTRRARTSPSPSRVPCIRRSRCSPRPWCRR